MRNKEIERNQAQKSNRSQVWRAKRTADKGKPSADIHMAFLLPVEFRAPSSQESKDFDEEETEEAVA